jgi:hypothetical protein
MPASLSVVPYVGVGVWKEATICEEKEKGQRTEICFNRLSSLLVAFFNRRFYCELKIILTRHFAPVDQKRRLKRQRL